MKIINTQIRGWSKNVLERTLGVTISRTKTAPSFYSDLRCLRTWLPGDVVFDVGANDGRTVMRLQRALPTPAIYAFEPVTTTFEILAARTRNMANVSCFKVAMGAQSGREEIYLNEMASMNSFLPDWSTPIGKETVEVTTVDRVMEEQGIEFIHFLKVDTEGFDLDVLKGAYQALASSRIGILQVEVRFDHPEILGLKRVESYLAPLGYHLYGFYNQCRSRGHQPSSSAEERDRWEPPVLAYADTVFVCANKSPVMPSIRTTTLSRNVQDCSHPSNQPAAALPEGAVERPLAH